MKNIVTILLNYNGIIDTIDCLISLKKIRQNLFTHQIIVVDCSNNSLEAEEISHRFKQIKVIRKNHNLGFAGGNNLGIKTAIGLDADYICLLNNDTLVSKTYLEKLFQFIEKNPKIGAVSPKIYFAKGTEYYRDRYKKSEMGKIIWYAGGQIDWVNLLASHRGVDEVDRGQFDQIIDTDFISGCCVLIRREVFEKVGILNEKLFLYWEDTDFSMRLKKFGYQIKYLPKSYIWHKNASGSAVGSDLHNYFLNRNRLWFGFTYAPIRTKLALFKQSLVKLINGNKWEKQAVKDYYQNKMYQGSWLKI